MDSLNEEPEGRAPAHGNLNPLSRASENIAFVQKSFDREMSCEPTEPGQASLSRLYAALTATNDAILRSDTAERMFEQVCESAVQYGVLVGAAIFLHDQPSSRFVLTACSGTEEAREIAANFQLSSNPQSIEGQGLGATAFRTGEPCFSTHLAAEPRLQPLRAEIEKAGMTTCAVLPLFSLGRPVGIMYVCFGGEIGRLDEPMVKLTARIAENVSFALDRFREAEQGDRIRKQNSYLFSAMNNIASQGLLLLDERDNIVMCNERYKQIYGLPADLVLPGGSLQRITEFIATEGSLLDDPASFIQAVREQVASKGRYEQVVRMEDGRSIRILNEKLKDGGCIALHEDITDSLDRDASFKLMFDNNPVAMAVFECATWKFIAVNDAALDLYGYTRDELLRLGVLDLEPIGNHDARIKELMALPLSNRMGRAFKHRKADGSLVDVRLFSHALTYDGRPARLAAAVDVTNQLRAEQEVRRARSFLNAVIENIPMPILVTAPKQESAPTGDWAYMLLNRAAEQFYGVTRKQWIGKTFSEIHGSADAKLINELDQKALSSSASVTSGDSPLVTPNGLVKIHRIAIRDDSGRAEYLMTLLEDVTEQWETSERIRHMALHDRLTGLPNRAAFEELFPKAVSTSADEGTELAVMCMDLDGFKEINDQYGHATGDEVLKEIATRLRVATNGAFLARVGGDEFVLLSQSTGGAEESGELAGRLIAASSEELDIEGKKLRVGISIGIALFPLHGTDCKALLANADLALYQAKNQQRGTIRYFGAALDSQVRKERALRKDLRRALENAELHLHYQPQVNMRREIIGYEALLRWKSPTRGDVSPMDFVPVAEQSGLIIPIGEWILREACREAASWSGQLKVAVNISPEQVKSTDLPSLVQLILNETGLSPSRLELEITESIFIDDFTRALSILMRLRALGVDIALDDFGTGYSALSYLHAFSFGRIKVDRSFVADLGMNERSDAIMRAIVSMAKSLGIAVLAEGVETEQQWSWLSEAGCDAVQGYLIGRPQAPQTLPYAARADLSQMRSA